MSVEAPKKPGDDARDIAATFFKLRSEAPEQAAKRHVSTGCAVCSVYEALARRGWLKPRSEADYRNHLLAKHGLEV